VTRTLKDVDRSERLRTLIRRDFVERGRFRLLEEASGINASKWKNFFYSRQEASDEQVQFWQSKFPEDARWLRTGQESSALASLALQVERVAGTWGTLDVAIQRLLAARPGELSEAVAELKSAKDEHERTVLSLGQ
jgi:hypothetical protein